MSFVLMMYLKLNSAKSVKYAPEKTKFFYLKKALLQEIATQQYKNRTIIKTIKP